MQKGIHNLRQLIDVLRGAGEIVQIDAPVSADLEIAEIHRRVAAADGPALFFANVVGSRFPVVTNLFGSLRRINLAFHNEPEKVVEELVHFATRDFPPTPKKIWQKRGTLKSVLRLGTKLGRRGAVTECQLDSLEEIPMLKSWPQDGGHFITLPLVYTECPRGGPPNLGMYRIQRHDAKTTGLHWQIVKGGGYHHAAAEELNQDLPVTIFVGGPPALIMSAIAPLPENVPEMVLASLLQGKKIDTTRGSDHPHPLISECEFAITGTAPAHVRHPEGPFGDHYGYYSWQHDFPQLNVKKIYHRKGAVYPATVVGKPRQEDFYIGDYLQRLLSPLFPVAIPGAKALWSYGETGFHSLSAAVVHERYHRECMATAFRILGEGQLSLTKFLLVTDQSVDLEDFPKTLQTVLERFRPETDLYIFANLSLDTLDYTGPALNKGSRGIMLGIGEKIRDLPTTFDKTYPHNAIPFCPGCLVIDGPPPTDLSHFDGWPLVILVDNAAQAIQNTATFLWTTFTRFEPAADISAPETKVHRHHLSYSGSILIDSRMKPNYPPALLCDDATATLVTNRWAEYFPQGMEMGPSDSAHVY